MSAETAPTGADRRVEQRCLAKGEVCLRAEGLMSHPVEGHLLDLSAVGFRARHTCSTLVPGQIVEFEFHNAGGRARVMWTQARAGTVESGFFILPDAA